MKKTIQILFLSAISQCLLLSQEVGISNNIVPSLGASFVTSSTQALIKYNCPPGGGATFKVADMQRNISILSATGDGTTVTVQTVAPHGLKAGTNVYIENTGTPAWNGWKSLTSVTSSSFTFLNSGISTSSSGNVGVLVDDVDPNLFTNANLDTRGGNILNGPTCLSVIGTRDSPFALDTNRHSRALQADARHHLSLTLAGKTLEQEFTTQNIPLGNTYNEGPLGDKNNPGKYAFPTIDWNNKAQPLIDPLNGLMSYRSTSPDNTSSGDQTFAKSETAPTGWGNPTGPISSGSATYTGGSGSSGVAGALFFRTDGLVFGGGAQYSSDGESLNWFTTKLTNTSINNGSCAGDNCKVVGCLTINGVACVTPTIEKTLTSSPSTYTFGTTTLMDLWQTSGNLPLAGVPPFSRVDASQASGTMTYNSSTHIVTWTGGNPFNIKWVAGSTITLSDNIEYTIASLQHEHQITLASGPASNLLNTINSVSITGITGTGFTNGDALIFGSGCTVTPAGTISVSSGSIIRVNMTNYGNNCTSTPTVTVTTGGGSGQTLTANIGDPPFKANNFGILLWKKTAVADTLTIGPATYQYGSSSFPVWPSLSINASSPIVSTSSPTFKLGYHLMAGSELYWIALDGSERRDLGASLATYRGDNSPWGDNVPMGSNLDPYIYDPLDGNTWYTFKPLYFSSRLSIVKVHYKGNQEIGTPGARMPDCLLNHGITPCLEFTIMQPNSSDEPEVAAPLYNPAWASSNYTPGSWHFGGVSPDGDVALFNWATTQDSPGWVFVYHLGDRTPMGTTSNSMKLIAGGSTYLTNPLTFCTIHDIGPPDAGWLAVISNDMGTPYGMNLTSGNLNNTTGITNGLNTCPANPYSSDALNPATGQKCTDITVDSIPTVSGGRTQAVQVGDLIYNASTSGQSEEMRVVKINGTNSFTVQRGFPGPPEKTGATNHSTPALTMGCGSNNNQNAKGVYWHYAADPLQMNANKQTLLVDTLHANSHSYDGGGILTPPVTISSQNYFDWLDSSKCSSADGVCDQIRKGNYNYSLNSPLSSIGINPSFANQRGLGLPNWVDTHPGPCFNAWCMDARVMTGAVTSSTSESLKTIGTDVDPFILVSGQLYRYTGSASARLHRKHLKTLAALGRFILVDISGPGSTIGTSSADAYKYCVAVSAGECRSGSSVGDVFVNAPYIRYLYCHYPGIAIEDDDTTSICISDLGAYAASIDQIGWTGTNDFIGANSRNLGSMFNKYNQQSIFWNVNTTPNGEVMASQPRWLDDVRHEDILTILPPYPEKDNITRNTFYSMNVSTGTPQGLSVDGAIVEFGYLENGDYNNLFNCTSRTETCVASTSSLVTATPFYFETSESSSWSPLSCVDSCSITIPALYGRVVYYRWKFYSGATLVSTGNTKVALSLF